MGVVYAYALNIQYKKRKVCVLGNTKTKICLRKSNVMTTLLQMNFIVKLLKNTICFGLAFSTNLRKHEASRYFEYLTLELLAENE